MATTAKAGLRPGSIDLIINGQIVTAGGTLTGIDVRDLLVEGRDLTPFTDNSTINGCLLTGAVHRTAATASATTATADAASRRASRRRPGIQDEVVLIDDDILPPPDVRQ